MKNKLQYNLTFHLFYIFILVLSFVYVSVLYGTR